MKEEKPGINRKGEHVEMLSEKTFYNRVAMAFKEHCNVIPLEMMLGVLDVAKGEIMNVIIQGAAKEKDGDYIKEEGMEGEALSEL